MKSWLQKGYFSNSLAWLPWLQRIQLRGSKNHNFLWLGVSRMIIWKVTRDLKMEKKFPHEKWNIKCNNSTLMVRHKTGLWNIMKSPLLLHKKLDRISQFITAWICKSELLLPINWPNKIMLGFFINSFKILAWKFTSQFKLWMIWKTKINISDVFV